MYSTNSSFYEVIGITLYTVQCVAIMQIYRPIGSAWNSPKTEKKTRSMRIKLAEHNKKKMKMASARKPQSFVSSGNEVEILLRLTLNYEACKLQESISISSAARTRACRPPLLLLWDAAGFRGQRLEVEGCGDGVIVSESMRICRDIVLITL